jgi:hypothetical protein
MRCLKSGHVAVLCGLLFGMVPGTSPAGEIARTDDLLKIVRNTPSSVAKNNPVLTWFFQDHGLVWDSTCIGSYRRRLNDPLYVLRLAPRGREPGDEDDLCALVAVRPTSKVVADIGYGLITKSHGFQLFETGDTKSDRVFFSCAWTQCGFGAYSVRFGSICFPEGSASIEIEWAKESALVSSGGLGTFRVQATSKQLFYELGQGKKAIEIGTFQLLSDSKPSVLWHKDSVGIAAGHQITLPGSSK